MAPIGETLAAFFLRPIGLAALAVALPIVILYLVRPDPQRYRLPTLRFLSEDTGEDSTNAVLERLQRNVLLLLQLLVLLALAASIATPYVTVAESTTIEETVVVVDATASMQTSSDGQMRFQRAVATARDEITETTSIVVVGADTRIPLRGGDPEQARSTLDGLRATDAPGDLRAGITQATSIAGEGARIVVLSDFAGADWGTAVEAARARDRRVALQQFAGGEENVAITDRTFDGQEVTLTVSNFGNASVQRELNLGRQSESFELSGGDVTTVTFDVPAGGGTATLSPGDALSADDEAYVAAPSDPTVDTMLVTNDRNRYLATALSVIDAVELQTVEPPAPDAPVGEQDVVVFSNVDGQRLLGGTVESAGAVAADGGGVAIQSQPDVGSVDYRDLLLIQPTGTGEAPALRQPTNDPITRGITFPPPQRFVRGSLTRGESLVETSDGSPMVATARHENGRLVYYGYIENASSFKYNYQYPVFWKRVVFYLAGRQSLPQLNHVTGDRLRFDGGGIVSTPEGQTNGSSVLATQAGWYGQEGGDRHGVSLLSPSESDVRTTPLDARSDGAPEPRDEERYVPQAVTHWVALAGLLLGVLELGYLKRRGDV
jgi:hypothetical protein